MGKEGPIEQTKKILQGKKLGRGYVLVLLCTQQVFVNLYSFEVVQET